MLPKLRPNSRKARVWNDPAHRLFFPQNTRSREHERFGPDRLFLAMLFQRKCAKTGHPGRLIVTPLRPAKVRARKSDLTCREWTPSPRLP